MQVHYACIAFFCARIAPVPLPPYSKNFSNMAKKIRKSVNSGNKEKVVKHYSEKPGNFEFYYGRCENPEKEWHKYQEWVWRRYPIVRRVRNFIKALADDFELKPQVVAYLEDCFRGYSPKMQISMFDTLHDYICYGDLITTGIGHVDRLVREMLSKIYNNKV